MTRRVKTPQRHTLGWRASDEAPCSTPGGHALPRRLLLLAPLLVAMLALLPASAQAADVHTFLPGPTEKISEQANTCTGPGALTGALGEVDALTVGPGETAGEASHLWVAEERKQEEGGRPGSNEERVDELAASTGKCEHQLEHPPSLKGGRVFHGVAVGRATGEREVYVGAQQENGGASAVVGVFGPSAALQAVWTGANTPNGSFAESGGPFTNVTDVAVDESAEGISDWARGDVLVSTASKDTGVVDVFKPEAALDGKEPAKVVRQLIGTCSEETICSLGEEEAHRFAGPQSVAVDPGDGDVLVADGHAVDVFEPVPMGLPGEYKFLRQITETTAGHTFESSIHALAAGGGEHDGDIYVIEEVAEGASSSVYQFNFEGVFLGSLTGTPSGPFRDVASVAVDGDPSSTTYGDVYVGDKGHAPTEPGVVDVFGADVVVPNVVTGAATGETPRGATLNGTVDPLKAETGEGATCEFLWGTSEALGHAAPCPAEVTVEDSPVDVEIGGLSPDTTYYYQLQAANKKGTDELGAVLHFTTPGPGIVEASATDVKATSATLEAMLEPHGVATSYRFEYDTRPYAPDEAAHGTGIPVPAEGIGSIPGEIRVQQHIQSLAQGATYYYRVVTVGKIEVAHGVFEDQEFDGEGHSFTTQGAGEFALPDNREWEMVSPPDKHGALLEPIDNPGTTNGDVIQAAASGNAITYVANAPTEPEPAGYANATQVFSTRGPEGWETHDLSVPHPGATDASVGLGDEYRFFSEDLSLAVVQPFGAFTALSPEATEQTAYVHSQTTGTYTPLVTRVGDDTASPFEPFGEFGSKSGNSQEEGLSCPPAVICGPQFVGATPDAQHVVLASSVALTATAIPKGAPQLYDWDGAEPASRRLQLISVLPVGEGGGPSSGASLGSGGEISNLDARGAISDDGSRVFFSVGQALYMRDIAKDKTLRLDLPEAGCESCGEGEAKARFQSASADGSRAFFTDSQRLTGNAGAAAGKPDLYECAVDEEAAGPRCELTDLTPRGATGAKAAVQGGALGASEDGSYIYFVADGALEDDGVPVPGAVHGSCNEETTVTTPGAICNLYVRHDGVTRLVAVLSGADFADWGHSAGGGALDVLTARVSPNGGWLAFMSDRQLTGYNNHGAANGKPDEEVYLYDATTGQISCASCEPSGAQQAGTEYGKSALVGGNQVWEASQWLAADVPGWTEYRLSTARYQSRYLSNTGRLFFNAYAPLVPADVNGTWDVYEYEPEGVGSCTSSTASGSDVFKPARQFQAESEGKQVQGEEGPGCVGLISSGESKDESAFLDASATGGKNAEGEGGGDVFFLTTEKLSLLDTDDSLDVYDAHECTAESPCMHPPVPPRPCDNEASCRPAAEPQPSIYGLPSSATFSGPGNVVPPVPPIAKPNAKPPTRAQKLRAALHACRRDRKRAKREACESSARKRFGPVKAKKRK